MKTYGELTLVWDSLTAESVERLNALKRPRKIAYKRVTLPRLVNYTAKALKWLKTKIKGEIVPPENLNGITIGELLVLTASRDPAEPFRVILGLDDWQISELSIAQSIGFINFIRSELERINALFADAHAEPTPEEKQAGVAEVGKSVGSFALLDYVAKRCGITHDEAERLPWPRVLAMMRLDRDAELFRRALQDVYKTKRK